MNTFKDVIAKFGSAEALGREIDEKGVTVRAWGSRGNIPMRYWAAIVAAAKRCGAPEVTIEAMTDIGLSRQKEDA